MIKDVNPSGDGLSYDINMNSIGNTVFFVGYDGVHGYELWKTNGDSLSTVMVRDINPGSSGGILSQGPMNQEELSWMRRIGDYVYGKKRDF